MEFFHKQIVHFLSSLFLNKVFSIDFNFPCFILCYTGLQVDFYREKKNLYSRFREDSRNKSIPFKEASKFCLISSKMCSLFNSAVFFKSHHD